MQGRKQFRIGDYVVGTDDRTIQRNGESQMLSPKEFDLLLLLAENAGSVVEKGDIISRLWPDTHVTEANLSQHIYRLRSVMGSEVIRTVPKKGYLLTAPVTLDPDIAPAPTPAASQRRWYLLGACALGLTLYLFISGWRARSVSPAPEAFDLLLRARARMEASYTQRTGIDTASERRAAIQLLQRAIEIDPNFSESHGWLAHAYCSGARFGDVSLHNNAANAAATALKLDPSSVAARTALICLAHLKGNQGEALRLATELRKTQHSSPEASFAVGEALFRAGLADLAIGPLRSAVSAAPAHVHYRRQLAYASMLAHRPAECVEVLSPILKREEGGYWEAINCYKELGQIDTAIAVGKKLLALEPENATAYRALGISLRLAGREQEARAVFEKAIRRFEGTEEIQRGVGNRAFLALLHAHLGHRAETEKWVRSAISLAPENTFTLFSAGSAYGTLGDDENAMSYLEQAYERGYSLRYNFDWQLRPEMGVRTLTGTERYKKLYAQMSERVKALEASISN